MSKTQGHREAARRGWRAEPPTPDPAPADPLVESLAATIRQRPRRQEPDGSWPDTGQGKRDSAPSVENPGTVEARRRWPQLADDND